MQLFLDQDKKPGLFNKYKPENIVQDNLMLKYYGEHPPLPVAATSVPTNAPPITSNGRTVNGGVPFNQLSNYARSKEVGPVNQQQVQDIQNINQGYQGINQKVEQSYGAIVDANHTNTIMQANLLAKGDLNNYDEYGNYHPPTIDNYDKAVSYIQNAAHKNFYTQTPYGNIKTGPMGIQPPPMLKGSDYKNMMRPEGPQYINDYESWTRQQNKLRPKGRGPNKKTVAGIYNIFYNGEKELGTKGGTSMAEILNNKGLDATTLQKALTEVVPQMFQDVDKMKQTRFKTDTSTLNGALNRAYNKINNYTGLSIAVKEQFYNHFKIDNGQIKPVKAKGSFNNTTASYLKIYPIHLVGDEANKLKHELGQSKLAEAMRKGYIILNSDGSITYNKISLDQDKLKTTFEGQEVWNTPVIQNLYNASLDAAREVYKLNNKLRNYKSNTDNYGRYFQKNYQDNSILGIMGTSWLGSKIYGIAMPF